MLIFNLNLYPVPQYSRPQDRVERTPANDLIGRSCNTDRIVTNSACPAPPHRVRIWQTGHPIPSHKQAKIIEVVTLDNPKNGAV